MQIIIGTRTDGAGWDITRQIRTMGEKTFISKFLELAEINVPDLDQWKWAPAGNVNCTSFAASTTCCGCTRQYGGGTDVGDDDND